MTPVAPTAAAVLALTAGMLPLRGEPTRELPPLIVTARRGSVLTDRAAVNATVIDDSRVARSGAGSLGELLATEGGLRLSSSTGDAARGTVHLRGFGENAASRILILIDGRPLNRPDMNGVPLLEIPLSRIRAVEILRGSQTARFGDNAVGGVINLLTQPNTPGTHTQSEFAAGSHGYLLARIHHTQSTNRQTLATTAEHLQSDGWRHNAQSEATSTTVDWSGPLGRSAELSSSLSWGDQSGRFPGPLTAEQYQADPRQSIYANTPFAAQYGSSQETLRLTNSVRWNPTRIGTPEIPLTWQQRNLNWNFGPGYHADNALDTLILSPTLQQSGDTWSLEQGLVLRHDDMDVTQFRDFLRRRPQALSALERTTTGAFASGSWDPLDDWSLNAAARIESSSIDAASRSLRFPNNPTLNFNRSHEESQWALQLGARWEPTATQALWVRLDRFYRFPGTDEIASYQGFPLSEPFNDQLEAETGHSLELGTSWSPGRWTLSATAFAQWMHGEITYDYDRNLNTNLDDTRRLGSELEAAYQATHWSASLRYEGVDARHASGLYQDKRLCLVPAHLVTSSIEIRPHRTLSLQVEHQFQDSAIEGNDFLNQRQRLPSFTTFNCILRYQPSPSLSCYLRINNVLDDTHASLKYNGLWYPAAGRQIQCGIRHEFD